MVFSHKIIVMSSLPSTPILSHLPDSTLGQLSPEKDSSYWPLWSPPRKTRPKTWLCEVSNSVDRIPMDVLSPCESSKRTRMCAHMHMHTHTCSLTHTCTHVHTHAPTRMCAHAHMHTCSHAHMHTRILTHGHACTLTHTYAHMCTCTHSHTRTHAPTHMHAHARIHALTHTHARMDTHTHAHTLTHTLTLSCTWSSLGLMALFLRGTKTQIFAFLGFGKVTLI